MVGAVVARGDRILAEAWHVRAGGAHAESAALRKAGASARGATLYTNLEPCCHYGRTPPCTKAILEAGIARVCVSHKDPDPRVNGKGIAALRRGGLRVQVGLLRERATLLNEIYLTAVVRGRPFVLVKAAMTLDGRIASRTGASRWISSPASRRLAHDLRAACGAVMVGAGTVAADDPRLTARRGPTALPLHLQPLRVVIDGRLTMVPSARMLRDRNGGDVIIYTARNASRSKAARLELRGATIRTVPSAGARIRLRPVLADLARMGVRGVMIEGGGELIASALEERIVDKVLLFVSLRLIGGRGAVPLVGGRGAASPRQAIALSRETIERRGNDLVIAGYPERSG